MPDLSNPQTWLDLGANAAAHWQTLLNVALVGLLYFRGKGKDVIERSATFAADLCRLLRDRPGEWAAAKGACGESDPNTLVHAGTGFTLRLDEYGAVSVAKPKLNRLSRAERNDLSAAYQSALTRQLEAAAPPADIANAVRMAVAPLLVSASRNTGPVKQV